MFSNQLNFLTDMIMMFILFFIGKYFWKNQTFGDMYKKVLF